MSTLIPAMKELRPCVADVMRIRPDRRKRHPRQKAVFNLAFVGTAWCIADGIFLTAHHVFNSAAMRDRGDKFTLFLVPDNGNSAFHFPVVEYVLEDAVHDLAILRIDPSAGQIRAQCLPVTFRQVDDGTGAITCGFPAPAIAGGQVAPDGSWLGGGKFFLKSHANAGIVAAHYPLDPYGPLYELNIEWHHGESGGPICQVEPLAAFAVMQRYRNIQSPHGIMAGPHFGVALEVIEDTLKNAGATIV